VVREAREVQLVQLEPRVEAAAAVVAGVAAEEAEAPRPQVLARVLARVAPPQQQHQCLVPHRSL